MIQCQVLLCNSETRLKWSRLVTLQTPMLVRPLLPFQVPEACKLLAGSYLWRICGATTFCNNSPNSQFSFSLS